MSHDNVETINLSPTLRVRIEYDRDPQSPPEWDQLGKIAYTSDRYTLGTERVSRDRAHEIQEGIESGELIGLPVYAYVHGAATIRAGNGNPFSCPWDSGQSGFVYCEKAKAIKEFGKKILTKRIRENVLKCLRNEVEAYDQYLTGDCYGIIVERVIRDEGGDIEDTEELASCWGFYGLDYAREEAKSMGEYQLKQDVKEQTLAELASEREQVEKAYWAARDVSTEGASL